MAKNPFDEFDEVSGVNPFDEFDEVAAAQIPVPMPEDSTTSDTLKGLGTGAADLTLGLSRQLYSTPSMVGRFGRTIQGALHDKEIPKPESMVEAAMQQPGIISSPLGVGQYLLEQGGDYIADKLGDAHNKLREIPGGVGQAFQEADARNKNVDTSFTETGVPDAMGAVFGKAVRNMSNLRFGDALDDLSDADIGRAIESLDKGKWGNLGNALKDPATLLPMIQAAFPSMYIAMRGGTPAMFGLEATGAATNVRDYERETGEKVSDKDFSRSVLQSAGINTIFEKAGIDAVLGKGKGALKGGLKGGVGEALTEPSQQVNSNIAELIYNKDKDLSEGVVQSGVGGFGTGAPMGAYNGVQIANNPVVDPNAPRINPFVNDIAAPVNGIMPDGRITPTVAKSAFDNGDIPGVDLPIVDLPKTPADAKGFYRDPAQPEEGASKEERDKYYQYTAKPPILNEEEKFDREALENIKTPIAELLQPDVQTGAKLLPSDRRAQVDQKKLDEALTASNPDRQKKETAAAPNNTPKVDTPIDSAEANGYTRDPAQPKENASKEERDKYYQYATKPPILNEERKFDRAELENIKTPIAELLRPDVQTGAKLLPSDRRAQVDHKKLQKAIVAGNPDYQSATEQTTAPAEEVKAVESATQDVAPVDVETAMTALKQKAVTDLSLNDDVKKLATGKKRNKFKDEVRQIVLDDLTGRFKNTAPYSDAALTDIVEDAGSFTDYVNHVTDQLYEANNKAPEKVAAKPAEPVMGSLKISTTTPAPVIQSEEEIDEVDVGTPKMDRPKREKKVKAPKVAPVVETKPLLDPTPVKKPIAEEKKFTEPKQNGKVINEAGIRPPLRQITKRVVATGKPTSTGGIQNDITKEEFIKTVNLASDIKDPSKFVDAAKETEASIDNPDGSSLTVRKVGNNYQADYTPAKGQEDGNEQVRQDGRELPQKQSTERVSGTEKQRQTGSVSTEKDAGSTGSTGNNIDSIEGTQSGNDAEGSAVSSRRVDNRGSVPATTDSTGGTGGGTDGRVEADTVKRQAQVFRAADDSSAKIKLGYNLNAIRTLIKLRAENRAANAQERSALRLYTGFGGISEAFPNPVTGLYESGFRELGEELKTLLSKEEYNDIKASTISAFYTSPTVIEKIYEAVKRLGFAGGKVLEPGSGTGRFIGLVPDDLAGKVKFVAVEMDSISGNIAKLLYPDSDVRVEDFSDTKASDNSFDMTIGNVPFADIKKTYKNQKLSLHDFFFAKAIDKTKEGGIIGLITSRFTMDKRSTATRKMFADQVDFIGGMRLPSSAFKGAGTEVVTDLLFFRKREAGTPASGHSWIDTVSKGEGEMVVDMNEYFDNNPHMILGSRSIVKGRFGAEMKVVVGSEKEVGPRMVAAIKMLPEGNSPSIAELIRPEVTNLISSEDKIDNITEGSLYVDGNGAIQQKIEGEAHPVKYMARPVTTDKPRGQRIAALIQIKNAARAALKTQNDNMSEAAKDNARAALNTMYDAFLKKYGPINEVVVRTDKNGKQTKSQPNLEGFLDDPDWALTASLENYNEETKSTTKAPILLRDVVAPIKPVTEVSTAQDGLIVSLNEFGKIDIDYIAKIYDKSKSEVIAELGNLIYMDPVTNQYQPADQYLSGNVRRKLEIAKAEAENNPDLKDNVKALQAVQPEDLTPGQIDVSLGAPWVPTSDIEAFAAEIFDVHVSDISVNHSPGEAKWSINPSYNVRRTVGATQSYGTFRINGIDLLLDALNMRLSTVYDQTYDENGKLGRVVNAEKTIEAREKQQKIKEKFASWIFTNQERAERLVRKYNDDFNNTRLRSFDGSHLTFPGITKDITLNPHQKDAVWRIIQAGNTLLAHAVGAGKTFTMIAAGMELRRIGVAKKPLYVVPNHMLGQFSTEFMQLYPNAKILVAPKEGFTAKQRKLMTAKIATGDWDGIITTMSSFSRMNVSQKYQRKFIQEQINDFEENIIAAKAAKEDRLSIKNLEKQKKRLEEKLKGQLEVGDKDTGLVYDELGIDSLFVDEAHNFKNLGFPTKINNVSGINAAGSGLTFDFYMKTRYIQEKTPGRGLVLATGTPISNSMAEMFTMQRYMQEDLLRDMNLNHFDAWVASFGEIADVTQLSPNGRNIEMKTKLARFKNIPELQQMFRTFADVKMAQDLKKLPRPDLEGGKATVIAAPPSEALDNYIQVLLSRMKAIKDRKVEPTEDNPLNVTTDGRKAATDMRLIDPAYPDDPASKLNQMINTVYDIWKESAADKKTQLIFSDIGINDTGGKFSIYNAVVDTLIKKGIPANEIARMSDAKNDDAKVDLFDKVRAGQVRVLIGSTATMGTGTNVQKKLYALHHLDAPWRPSDVEQREGRIVRQRNENKTVRIYRYVTESSFDAYMWQILENKARFISQIMRGEAGVRVADDSDTQELSFAEIKAIASGNPAVMELAKVDAEVVKLSRLEKSHIDEQYRIKKDLQSIPDEIANMERGEQVLKTDIKNRKETKGEAFEMTLGGKKYNERAAADKILHAIVLTETNKMKERRAGGVIKIGTIAGFDISLLTETNKFPVLIVQGVGSYKLDITTDGMALVTRLENIATGLDKRLERVIDEKNVQLKKISDLKKRDGAKFEYTDKLKDLKKEQKNLQESLKAVEDETVESDPVHGSMVASAAKEIFATNDPELFMSELSDYDDEALMTSKLGSMVDNYLSKRSEGKGGFAEKAAEILNDGEAVSKFTSDVRDQYEKLKEGVTSVTKNSVEEVAAPQFTEKFSAKVEAIKAEVQKIAQKMNPNVPIEFADNLFGEGQAIVNSGSKSDKKKEIGGVFTTLFAGNEILAEFIKISLNTEKYNPVTTAYHELWHSLEKLLTSEEQRLLRAIFPGGKMTDAGGMVDHFEQVAYAFQEWAMDRHGKGLIPATGRIFTKIRSFLRMVGDTLRGESFLHVEDVFSQAVSGKIGKRTTKYIPAEIGRALRDPAVTGDPRALSDVIAKYSVENSTPETLLDNATKWMKNEIRMQKSAPKFENSVDLNHFQKAIVTPRTIAQAFKSFAPVWHAVTKQFERRDNMAMEIGKILEPYYNLERKSKDKVNAVLELGRLNRENFEAGEDGTITVQNIKHRDAGLSKTGQTIKLTKKEAEGYLAAREGMDNALVNYIKMLVKESGVETTVTDSKELIALAKDGEAESVVTAVDEIISLQKYMDNDGVDEKALYKAIDKQIDIIAKSTGTERAEEIRKIVSLSSNIADIEEARKSGYVPFSRFGNYAIVVKDSDGNLRSRVHMEVDNRLGFKQVKAAYNRREATRITEELRAKYPASEGYTISDPMLLNTQAAIQTAGVDLRSLDTVVLAAGIDPTLYRDDVRKPIEEELKKRGFRKHFIRSKNVPGYSTDFERGIGDYVMSLSSYIARRETLPEITEAVSNVNPVKERLLREYTERYVKYIQDPSEEWHRWKAAMFFYTLAGNLGSAAVNTLQTPMVSAPYMLAFNDEASVVKEFTRAYGDVKRMIGWKGVIPFIDPARAPIDVREDLMKADADGYLVPAQTLDQMGVATSSRSKLMRDRKAIDKTVKFLTNVYSSTERINRMVTYIAVHRLGNKEGMAEKVNKVLAKDEVWNSKGEDYTPDLLAKQVIDETHFKMGKMNRAQMNRGAGGVILQFKSYSFFLTELLFRMASKMGKEGKKAFIVAIFALWSAAGILGLPFAGDVVLVTENIVKMAWDERIDIDRSVQEFFNNATGYNRMGEIIMRGPARLGPFDIHGRVGMGNIIPGIKTIAKMLGDEKLDPQEVARDIAGVSAGRAFGNTYDMFTAAKDGRPLSDIIALSPVTPTFASNILQGQTWGSHGVPIRGSSKIHEDMVTPFDVVMKTIGLTPSSVARVKEMKNFEANIGQAVTDKQSRYYKKLVAAALAGDYEKISDLSDEILEYNEGKELFEQIVIDKGTLKGRLIAAQAGIDSKTSKKATPKTLEMRDMFTPSQYRDFTKSVKTGDTAGISEGIKQGASRDDVHNAVKDARIPELDRIILSKEPSKRAIEVYKGIANE